MLQYYNTVPNYHRRSLRNYRSDQIEQQLTSYSTTTLLKTLTNEKSGYLVPLYITRMTTFFSSFVFDTDTSRPTSVIFDRHVSFTWISLGTAIFVHSTGVGYVSGLFVTFFVWIQMFDYGIVFLIFYSIHFKLLRSVTFRSILAPFQVHPLLPSNREGFAIILAII